MSRRFFGVIGAALLVCAASACEPEATPLPVNLPTLVPPTATASAPQALRYALAPGVNSFIPAADRAQIAASAQLIDLDAPPNAADLDSQYDLLVSLAALPDSTSAPQSPSISLSLDTSLPPLDDPDLAQIVVQAVNPQALAVALDIPAANAPAAPAVSTAALRDRLANAGYPDGFDLTLADGYLPGGQPAADALAQMLNAVGIGLRLTDTPAHLTFTTTAADTPDVIPLFTLPIYFRAADGLTITFTPAGFPIAAQPPTS